MSETVTVPGSTERGASFVTSTWRVTVVGSAYFPWPDDSGDRQQWRTVLYTNIDRPIKWSDERISGITESANPDAVVGVWDDDTLRSDAASASTFGQGSTVTLQLREGQTLLLAPIDEQDAYTFPTLNRGEVVVDIRLER